MEKLNLQELCRQRKEALGLTRQEIAESAGVPEATVKNFLSHASKAPSVYTVGPICAALGISLDEYFGITDHMSPTEETLSAKNDTLKAHREELEQRVVSKDKTINILLRGIRTRNHIMLFMGAIIVILLVWAASTDLACGDIGLFRR